MDSLSILKLCLARVSTGQPPTFGAIATSIISQQAGHPPHLKCLQGQEFRLLPPPPPDPRVGAANATYSASPDVYKSKRRLLNSFQNDLLRLGAEQMASIPYLPDRLQRAMDAGDWSSELSLAADQAIAQADARHKLEWGVSHGQP